MLAYQFRVTSEINKTEPVQRTQLLLAANQLKEDRIPPEQVNSLCTEFDRVSADPQDIELKEGLTRPDPAELPSSAPGGNTPTTAISLETR